MGKIFKVAYATGSRADYGIVRHFLYKLNDDPDIDFSVLVTGSHLEETYGESVNNIKEDDFHIAFKAKLDIDNKTNAGVIHSMAKALDAFGSYFEDEKYDLLIILGDRYEMMAVAIAACMQKIPILHLHGGEVTYGNYDEFIRHCISKMSTYHFTSTSQYRKRVIQLGEDPDRVFYMGALGAENCQNINNDLVNERVKELPKKEYFVVAFHPETLTGVNVMGQVENLLKAIETFIGKYKFVLMGTNADTGSNVIRETWRNFAENNESVEYIENLNVDSYLHMVKNSIALIGNSSSGIIEAPSLGVFTINIGERQGGRVSGNSVVNVICDKEEIIRAINSVLYNIRGKSKLNNPYYLPYTVERYYQTTKNILANLNCTPKTFYDLDNEEIN